MTLIEQIQARIAEQMATRAARQTELDTVLSTVEQRGDGAFTEDEQARFNELRSDLAAIDKDVEELEARVAELRDADERRARAAAITPPPAATSENSPHVAVRSEPRIYEQHPGQHIRDVVRAQVHGDDAARQRLVRHQQEMDVEFRAVGRTTDAELGYLVPPLYAINDYAELARSGRPIADAIGSQELPAGIDQVRIPRITTGTKVAAQNGDKASITTRDIVTAETSADLVTIAGYIDVAVQAIDQSPLSVQDIIYQDLLADYAMQLENQIVNGDGTSETLIGLLNIPNIGTKTYTSTAPTVGGLYRKVGENTANVHATRFQPAQLHFMHPTRWAWITSAVDSDGRPLAGYSSSMPQNVGAYVERVTPEARGGTLQNLPVVTSHAIPTTLGTGTNEDRVITARITDARLWEGTPRLQVSPVVDASEEKLLVRIKFWRYVIFLGGRQPSSYSVLSGTGLSTPTFT